MRVSSVSLPLSVSNVSHVPEWSKLTTSASGWQDTNTLAIHDDYWFKKKITGVTVLVLQRTLSIREEPLN